MAQAPPMKAKKQPVVAAERVWGVAAALVLMLAIYLGSSGLANFDSALIGYAVGIVALTYAIVSRYARWLRMPSTRRYWRRGWQLATSWESFKALPGLLPRAIASQLLLQGFIRRRGVMRWIGHQCLFWGVILSTLITFPLVFGWLAFKIEPGSATHYRMWAFGFPTITFDSTTFIGWSIFHALNYTAVITIAGCAIFLWRRFRDRAVVAGQRLGYDMLPLLMLVVISVTGLLLTASASLFHGAYYDFLVVIHMASVVLALVFIPFGKFFHVVQRPASVGIQMYAEINLREGRVPCARCGEPLAPQQFVDDLQATLAELGQDYSIPARALPSPSITANDTAGGSSTAGGSPNADGSPTADLAGEFARAEPSHLTELCPRCKRVARAGGYFHSAGTSFAR